jgi:signal recognition particle GTPase
MTEVCRYLNEPSSYVSSNLTGLVVLSQAVKRGKREGFDIVLCDTSGRTVVVTHWGRI